MIVVLAWKMVSKRISLALAGSSCYPFSADGRRIPAPVVIHHFRPALGHPGKRPAGGTIDLCFGLRMGGFTGPAC